MKYRQALFLEQRQVAENNKVVDYLNKGYCVIVTNTGRWWCDDGKLIEFCTCEEEDALKRLQKKGHVKITYNE